MVFETETLMRLRKIIVRGIKGDPKSNVVMKMKG